MRVDLLGELRIEGGGHLPRRERIVLGALVIGHGRVVSAGQLADALWGEELPSSWHTQVQICVAHLRRVLRAGAIDTVGAGYRLCLDGDDIDVYEFEQLVRRGRGLAAGGEHDRAAASFARALALWRGRPFDDLTDWEPGSSESARLGELHLSTEEDLIEARLASGEHRDVAAAVEPLVAAAPLRERRWALLALTQYRCGRQAEALRSLTRARRLLADQLGIDPGPELVALERAILGHDTALAAPKPPGASGSCPYKGLASYDADDSDLFFGRDSEITALLGRLASVSLVVVAGPSGCGKSSLVRAGLVPALRGRGRTAVVCVPGQDPQIGIAAALAGGESAAVLVVDQFEELFTIGDPGVVTAVVDRLIARTAEAPVVICVRSDFLGGLSIVPEFARRAEQGLHLVSQLSGDSLREAIERPATEAGLRLERGLVDLLVRDTEGEPGALPLLSHALAETWRRRDGHTLTVEGYRATGGIRGAVARSADQLYDGLPAEQRATVRSVVLRLVAPSLEGEPVRCRVNSATWSGDREREYVIALLVRARLVIAASDSYELAHEALARAWPRLQSWLEEDVAGQRILRHLSAAAQGWDSLGRPNSELYRGARLETAREWRGANQPELTALEDTFLDASEAHERSELELLTSRAKREARQNRRLRRAVALIALLAAGSLVAGVVAVGQRRLADTARDAAAQSALVNASVALRNSRRDLAALLAVEAHRLAPSAETENALFGLFTAFPGIGRAGVFKGGELMNGNGLLLPDDATLVGTDDRGVVRLIDLATGADRAHLGSPGEESWGPELAVTADGRFLAVADDLAIPVDPPPESRAERSTVSVWDLSTSTAVFEDVTVPIEVGSVAINSDGSLVAVGGGYHGRTFIIDGRSGEVVRELAAMPRPADAFYKLNTVEVAFTADNRLIVTSQAGPIRFFDPHTGSEVARIDGLPQTAEAYVSLSTDERWMITSGRNGIVRYELPSGKPTWPAPAGLVCQGGTGLVESIGIFLCGERGNRLLSVDVATGGLVSRSFESVHGNSGVLAGRSGSTVLIFSGAEYTMWRTDGSSMVNTVLTRDATPYVAGYTADGARLILVDEESVEVVDPATGTVTDRVAGARDARPTGDPQRLVASFADGTIGWYDLASHARTGVAVEPGLPIDGFTNSPGGALVWSSNGSVADIDLQRGVIRNPGQRLDPAAWDIAVSPDGDVFTGTIDGAMQRRDGASLTVRAASDLAPMRFAAGNDLIAASLFNGEHVVLDAQSMRPTGQALPATRGFFTDMVLDAPGRRLLALGADNELRLYDLAARTQLGGGIAFDGSGPPDQSERRGVALRPDGLQAAVPTKDGIAIWDLDPEHWAAAACEMAGRNLTKEEWATYIGNLAGYRTTCSQFG